MYPRPLGCVCSRTYIHLKLCSMFTHACMFCGVTTFFVIDFMKTSYVKILKLLLLYGKMVTIVGIDLFNSLLLIDSKWC